MFKFKKKYTIELIKGETLPHLWTHSLATADAILYIVHEETSAQSNIKDITELLLDDRTTSMPKSIIVNNIVEKHDKLILDELHQAFDTMVPPEAITSISGSKREIKMHQITDLL